MINAVIIFVILALIALITRKLVIISKRSQRKSDLGHHIVMIIDPSGCDQAIKHYNACKHIVEHYGITLDQVRFPGDLSDLWTEVGHSLNRAKERQEDILKSVRAHRPISEPM